MKANQGNLSLGWQILLLFQLVLILGACDHSGPPRPVSAPAWWAPSATLPGSAGLPDTPTVVADPTATWTAIPASATPTQAPTATELPTASPTVTLTPTEKPLIYIFPVQPPEVAYFYQGHHDYPATDIFAPTGTTFVAVTDGVIDFVRQEDLWDSVVNDPDLRGGLAIALIGDDGVRYYGSHLSAVEPGIAPGVQVVTGQVLGYVGNSGNARGIASHLHFGISHPTSPEDWQVRRGEVDPYPYLIAWLEGNWITPVLP